MEIEINKCYRAKKPRESRGYYNDRVVIWMSDYEVQYDGPAVANGRKYPTVPLNKFEEWAGADVTDSLPAGDWQEFSPIR